MNKLPQGELRFISHVEERYDADPEGFVGLEICNRHTDAKLDKSVENFLKTLDRTGGPKFGGFGGWQRLTQHF